MLTLAKIPPDFMVILGARNYFWGNRIYSVTSWKVCGCTRLNLEAQFFPMSLMLDLWFCYAKFRMNFEACWLRFRHHPGSVQSTKQSMVRIRIDPSCKDSRSYQSASRWVGLENPCLGSIFSRWQPAAVHRRSACLG